MLCPNRLEKAIDACCVLEVARGNRLVSKNFQNRPGEKGGDHVEGSFMPETFRVVGTRK